MRNKFHGAAHGIALKKQFGQHFLREQRYVDCMLNAVQLIPENSLFEIGCGDGFLTRSIQKQNFARLWVFEIDHSWAEYVKHTYPDERMTMFEENILDVDFSSFESFKPWTLLSNLPYQITFPLLHRLVAQRHLLKEGVIMIQEEVAQKIVKKQGRGYGYPSLFFQHFFEWQLLDSVPASAFYPPPKVESRLLYFKPKAVVEAIVQEDDFWQFIKRSFAQPRRTLKNNLHSFHYDLSLIPQDTLALRAQQMSMEELLEVWKMLLIK